MNYTKTIIRQTGKIYIDGKTYSNIKGTMEITDRGVFVNGVPIEEYKEPTVINLILEGNVDSIIAENGDVTVNGDVGSIESKNGNVSVKGTIKGNVESKNGNVTIAGDVKGDVNAKNGNVIY